MGHANIYIRKENETRWDSITDKSAWVNAYLAKSPPNSIVVKEQLEPTPKALPPVLVVETNGRPLNEVAPIKIDKAQRNGVCKIHGTPLDSRGRCLQKGCKYA